MFIQSRIATTACIMALTVLGIASFAFSQSHAGDDKLWDTLAYIASLPDPVEAAVCRGKLHAKRWNVMYNLTKSNPDSDPVSEIVEITATSFENPDVHSRNATHIEVDEIKASIYLPRTYPPVLRINSGLAQCEARLQTVHWLVFTGKTTNVMQENGHDTKELWVPVNSHWGEHARRAFRRLILQGGGEEDDFASD